MNVFRHSGDLGDIIASLPVIRALCGGQLILGNVNGLGAREPMTKERFDVIAPLLEKQPYIQALSHEHDAKGVTHDLHDFRQKTPMRVGEHHTLVNWQSDHFGLGDVDLSPWLTGITPSQETKGKVIWARTTRYWNPNFRWCNLLVRYPNPIFVGLEAEWVSMMQACGQAISWRKTSNLLEVAELIAGCDLFIGNQSAPFWIALGLGKTLILEADGNNCNCIIRERENATYCLGAYP